MKQFRRIYVMMLAALMLLNVFGCFTVQVSAENWDQEDLASIEHVLILWTTGRPPIRMSNFSGSMTQAPSNGFNPAI